MFNDFFPKIVPLMR